MVTAEPPEETITIDHFPVCEQECMRQESWQYNIEKKTFTTLCVGEHRKHNFLVWVRDQLEHCFWHRCGLERDGDEIKDLWAWYKKTCESAP
ncbi:hypothetical protein QM012_003170 [Aureobasidium pullulans]|uniref:Uncharacterized protein n=1 Tax=Aureobasidium pullulans TaxID=5580 RepID=A0ABR0TAD8_AURPU